MKILLIVCTLSWTGAAFAQLRDGDIHISRGKIFTNEVAFVEGQPIVITNDSVEFYPGNSTMHSSLALNRVEKILKYNGNWGTTGAWVGSILGVGAGFIAAVRTEETTRTGNVETTTVQIWPVYAGAVLGGIVGLLIGRSSDDMTIVYSRPHVSNQNRGTNANIFGEVSARYSVRF